MSVRAHRSCSPAATLPPPPAAHAPCPALGGSHRAGSKLLPLHGCRQDVTEQKARPWIWRDKLQSRWRYVQVRDGSGWCRSCGRAGAWVQHMHG